jgi:plasmid maintenance system killer protein
VKHGKISKTDFFFLKKNMKKKMNNEDKAALRIQCLALASHQNDLDRLNSERLERIRQKTIVENNIKLILEKPECSEVNVLSLADGKTIKVIRQHSKGWSLAKSRFRDLVHEFWDSAIHKNPENLINYVYQIITAESQSHEMKLELR